MQTWEPDKPDSLRRAGIIDDQDERLDMTPEEHAADIETMRRDLRKIEDLDEWDADAEESERLHRLAIISTGRRNGKDLDAAIVAEAYAAGIDPASEAFAEVLQRAAEKIREVAAAILDLRDAVAAAINEAWPWAIGVLEEIEKSMEQYEDLDEPEEEDRHDGAIEVLKSWGSPVPTLRQLYGQGVDYGGPGPSRLVLIRATDDGPWRAETGINRKGERTNEEVQRLRPGGNGRH